ncbi:MAG: hypothetical protein DME57_08835 [Verrucomicrobia bacterium]|nr:MAG: hypothetical protein DME57_08835 [Verrucomicrobiota bacterium]
MVSLVEPRHFDHYQNNRPRCREQKNAENDHVFCTFARGRDQIFAANVVSAKISLIVRPVMIPTVGTRLKETVGAREALVVELEIWLH